jgi:hypothetical protein
VKIRLNRACATDGSAALSIFGRMIPAQSVDWLGRATREVVLPAVRPRVLVYWMTEPDQSQHLFGVGSPPSARRVAYRRPQPRPASYSLGPRLDSIDFLIVSDHGFVHGTERINVTQSLVDAGLKRGLSSADAVLADDGQSMQFYVRDHEPAAAESELRIVYVTVRDGLGYEAREARQRLGDRWYVDAGWRVR